MTGIHDTPAPFAQHIYDVIEIATHCRRADNNKLKEIEFLEGAGRSHKSKKGPILSSVKISFEKDDPSSLRFANCEFSSINPSKLTVPKSMQLNSIRVNFGNKLFIEQNPYISSLHALIEYLFTVLQAIVYLVITINIC